MLLFVANSNHVSELNMQHFLETQQVNKTRACQRQAVPCTGQESTLSAK